ncbi:hypothetical protein [Methylobacterium sp. E-045]|uniref:hypothetical protein n=1 Tax=Methylobacterium sp. E-045 TaxID=2836575 RepID=UPI001FBC0AA3|nr:hypothetical protein [Methylobacterium sp. E-045]MCJ2131724.1 hypothetical protein [Methylobacterium sp. E-045]
MSDLSATIAKMIIEMDGIPLGTEPSKWVDCVWKRWPNASPEEIKRGFLIAVETAKLEEATRHLR